MAEFVKVAKEYKRMCDSFFNDCRNCPFNEVRDSAFMCRYGLIIEPETAERVVMEWAKKNPIVANKDKFKEVFGYEPYSITIFNDEFIKWLNKEYKEPEKR